MTLKGKAEPVGAFALLEVRAESDGLARNPEALLVGRKRERNRLWRDFEDVLDEQSCRLVTLLGPAGIGKSRLVADFLERVGDSADTLRGRCLSYGEGITYWPLVEILIAIGVEPDSVIGTSPAETQLAFRRLLEARAAERPQVVVVDDLQWAEPVFIDLVEHIADLSRDAPIFLLCVARTELLDVRPDWGGGKVNATSILLEPLADDECEALIGNLLGDGQLEGDLLDRITAASAGNPLYVEEMLAMVREHGGDGEIIVPPTIHALLQARIDSLDGDVRVVMERGSVEGEVFHRGAVAELSPAPVRGDVQSHLATLVRKELIRSTAPTFPEDEGYRFRHLLIRDAAYESLPKTTRAELHERFADWLSAHELVERDEIVGYHLEQAHRYRAELDRTDSSLPGLAARASEHLASAGRGALERGDFNAGRTLLQRAAALLPLGDERRAALAPDLFSALEETGDTAALKNVLAEARDARDPVVRATVSILEANFDLHTNGALTQIERAERRDAARSVLEEAGDDPGLSLYWWSVGREAWFRCRAEETTAACERAMRHAEKAGARRLGNDALGWTAMSAMLGPMPVQAAIDYVDALHSRHESSILADAYRGTALGMLHAMTGEGDRGLALVRDCLATLRDAGLTITAAGLSQAEGWCARYGGDLSGAQRALREGFDVLQHLGDRGYLPTVALMLADLLYLEGRYEEIDDLCAIGRATTTRDDLINFVFLDMVEARMLARRGRYAEAEERARDAVERGDTTDLSFLRAEPRLALAEVLALAGRRDEAVVVAVSGLCHFDEKGDVVGAVEARDRLSRVGVVVD